MWLTNQVVRICAFEIDSDTDDSRKEAPETTIILRANGAPINGKWPEI